MHNNYFFLKRLAHKLDESLKGFRFGEIFTQNKEELIIGLYDDQHSFYIKANLNSQFSCLSFPDDYARAKKNSVDLFGVLLDQKIQKVRIAENDRSLIFSINEYSLVFKLYGNRSNVILFNGNAAIEIFKQKFKNDLQLQLNKDFDKQLDLSFENFQSNFSNLNKFIPTLSKADLHQLFNTQDYLNNEEAYQILIKKIKDLEHSNIHLSIVNGLPKLSLYKTREHLASFNDPIVAINEFYQTYSKNFFLEKRKQQLISNKQKELKKIRNYLVKTNKKQQELVNGQSYQQIADIIMANLHAIKTGSAQVELFDFYNNQNISIKLKKDLSPQKNAENYYRKAKNQKIEIEKINENILEKELMKDQLENEIDSINQETNYKELKKYDVKEKEASPKDLPYHTLQDGEFQILIGKNAKNNDVLTFKVAHKDDLWLHVKDAPGSHVVIRQIAGKKIGTPTLEKAASLAAWFSKRKTEGLVPVTWTERKHVRKTKNLLPGQVIVQKENVILAEPVNWLVKN